ncbi:MAG TPA: DUF1801 domain-containing protein [Chitinophagaceae bacterium]|nr:DUF1801 domain-containing protein [Chitinophagaceae bacterium]
MANAKNKTTETEKSVSAFVKSIPDAQRQKDALAIIDIMKAASGFEPKMWGAAIIGFGNYHYKYESGREGDAPLVGFSPRKSEFALYFCSVFEKREELLKQFGKHKASKGCVYFKKMEDIKPDILKKMAVNTIKYYKSKYK